MDHDTKIRVRISNEEIAGVGNNMPMKPKAPASPESESEISEHDRIIPPGVTTPRRHKVKSVPEADVHTQQGE